MLEGHNDLISCILFENLEKGIQYRLAVTEFRGVNYLTVREWYITYDGDFAPTRNGFNVPYTLHTAGRFFHALKTLLSQAETLEEVRAYDFTSEQLQELKLVHDVREKLGISSEEKLEVVSTNLAEMEITLKVVKND